MYISTQQIHFFFCIWVSVGCWWVGGWAVGWLEQVGGGFKREKPDPSQVSNTSINAAIEQHSYRSMGSKVPGNQSANPYICSISNPQWLDGSLVALFRSHNFRVDIFRGFASFFWPPYWISYLEFLRGSSTEETIEVCVPFGWEISGQCK